MFDNQNPNANQKLTPPTPGPAKQPVEDIFSQMDGGTKASRPEILAPKDPGQPGEKSGEVDVFKKSVDSKRIVLAGIGLSGIILIFIGAWYSYNIFLPKRQETKENPAVAEEKDEATDKAVATDSQTASSTGATGESEELNEDNSGALFGTDVLENPVESGGEEKNSETDATDSVRDSDNDGLKDAEEAELGTDPEKIDTDGDGLFDNEEVSVYKTDPLNPDTDGDSYSDGSEIKNGYDPKGPGKLFGVIPAE